MLIKLTAWPLRWTRNVVVVAVLPYLRNLKATKVIYVLSSLGFFHQLKLIKGRHKIRSISS